MTGPRVLPGPVANPSGRCINRRHDHTVRQGAACDRPLPPPPAPHRIAGAVAVGVAATFAGAVWVGWQAGDWLANDGRILAAITRRKTTR